MPIHPATGEYTDYYSQAARDAARNPEWAENGYADYIERSALQHCAFYVAHGDFDGAQRMLTRSLGQSLMGNEGE